MGRFIRRSRAWAWAKLSTVGFILCFRLCVAKDGKMVPFGLHEASSLLSGAAGRGGGMEVLLLHFILCNIDEEGID